LKKSLQDNSDHMRVILDELSVGPVGRIELLRRFVKVSKAAGSPGKFDAVFPFLVFSGYVVKSGVEKRAPYILTPKGRKMLEALS
jgi:hypothetical protein